MSCLPISCTMIAKPTKQKGKAYIVDASVVIKLFSIEEGCENARRLFKASEKGELLLQAPDLLLYEVGNALWKGKKLPPEQVTEALVFLLHSSLECVPLSIQAIHRASVFAAKYNLTFYDAVYGALAYVQNVPLVSANVKDHSKIAEISMQDLAAL